MTKITMMKKFFIVFAVLASSLLGSYANASETGSDLRFFDVSAPVNFLELQANLFGGGSAITQNYASCLPEIKEINMSTGVAVGVGASARFAIRNFIALGTEFNILSNRYTLDMAIRGDHTGNVRSVFLRNSYYTVNIPVFISIRFNISRGVRWDVESGFFFTYGIGGSQKQAIYDSRLNDDGQLMMSVHKVKCGYYSSPGAFINSARRGDWGYHLATGLLFNSHYYVGLRTQIGFKNVSKSYGAINPNIHNVNILGQLGYRF